MPKTFSVTKGSTSGGSSEWTDTGTLLHPADLSGAENVAIGGTTTTAPIVLGGASGQAGQASYNPTASISNPPYAAVWDEATTNLIPNPSFEFDANGTNPPTGWADLHANSNATVTTSSPYVGDKCCQIVVTPATATAGIVSNSITTTVSKNYIFSLWMKGNAGGEAITLAITGSSSGATTTTTSLTTDWRRYFVFKTLNGSDTSVTVSAYTSAATAPTWFIDGCQLEQKNVSGTTATSYESTWPTSYCDGSIGFGHSWSGTAHNSASSRVSGFHILAPFASHSMKGFAIKPDGTITGPLRFTPDIQYSPDALWGSGIRNNTNPRSPYYFKGYFPATALQFGNLGSLVGFKNTANAAAGYFESAATTESALIVNGPSVSSGTIFAVYAPSTLTTMQSSGGKLLDFADKSGASTFKVGVNFATHGAANLNYRHYQLNMGAGKYAKTSTSRAGTVGTQITNRTGTIGTGGVSSATITGVGTSFGTAGQVMVGDTILVLGATRIVTAIASATSMTVNSVITLAAGQTWKNTNIVEGSGTAFTTDFAVGDIIVIDTAEQVIKALDSATILRTVTPFGAVSAGTSYTDKDAQYEPWFMSLGGPNGDHETLDYVDKSATFFINGEDRPKLIRQPAVAGTGTIQTNMTGGSECCVTGSGTSFTTELTRGDIIISSTGQRRVVANVVSATQLITRTAFNPALAATAFTYINTTLSTLNPDVTSRYEPNFIAPAADTDGKYFVMEEARETSSAGPSATQAETSLFTTTPTIDGGRLGTKGQLRAVLAGTLSGANSSATMVIRVKMGSTTVLTTPTSATFGSTNTFHWRLAIDIMNNASASAQNCVLQFHAQDQTTVANTIHLHTYATATVNTANDFTFDVTFDAIAAFNITAACTMKSIECV